MFNLGFYFSSAGNATGVLVGCYLTQRVKIVRSNRQRRPVRPSPDFTSGTVIATQLLSIAAVVTNTRNTHRALS